MDSYEKKYKEALSWMQSLYDGLHGATKKDAEHYFPELKESEDEKAKRILNSISNKMSFHLHDIFTDEEFQCFDAWSNAWLEKQGEQKQDPCNNCKDIMLNCHNFPCIKKKAFEQGKSVFDVINEEKADNANKVKHKFNEGDWVVNRENKIVQIKALKKDKYNVLRYCIEWKDGKKTNPLQYYTDNYCHLWTLSDVKNGDILYSSSLHLIWIYKDNKEVHVGININYPLSLSINTGLVTPNDACLATKEQREQLEKAMADAGYTFDFEKKELKRIEKPIEWSYEDEANLNNIIWLCNNCIKGSETTWIPSQATKIKHLIETIKEKGLVQQNPAWSEEDEVMLDEIIDFFENGTVKLQHDLSLYASWLKSLKDRYTWKPSDEQMKAFENFVRGIWESCYDSPYENNAKLLYSLLEQLKKLKVE